MARHLSAASGTDIHYRSLTEEEATAQMTAAGLGPERVDRLLGFYRRVRAGFCAPVHSDVEAVLGRPPRAFGDFAAEHARHWKGAGSRFDAPTP